MKLHAQVTGNRSVSIKSSSTERIVYVCPSAQCTFKLVITRQSKDQDFKVYSVQPLHTNGCLQQGKGNAKVLATIARQTTGSAGTMAPAQLQSALQSAHGVQAGPKQLSRALALCNQQSIDAFQSNVQYLEAMVDAVNAQTHQRFGMPVTCDPMR